MSCSICEMFFNWSMIVSIMARLRSSKRSPSGINRCFMLRSLLGDELNASDFEQLFCQLLRNITLVSKHFAKQLLQQLRHGSAVVGVARSQHEIQQFASIIHDQMQLCCQRTNRPKFCRVQLSPQTLCAEECGDYGRRSTRWNP